ncbi:MAG: LysM peptidoglycan-binding domain-containing protein [Kiritimatiellales bacterium]|nr:LysM peptidoglycan-binding domain-containing protein [Kiritimatiellales bacterium]
MRYIYLALCISSLVLCGCNKDAKSIEEKEERNPLVKTGQSYIEIKDWDKAETAFKQAIENNPTMARPHLELAMIYQQYKINYIYAIYHYDRYLELRPDSEKTTFINEQKMKVARALANTLINNSPEVKQVVDELKRLQQENATLKRQIASKATAAAPVQQKPAAETAPSAQQKTVTQTVPKSAIPSGTASATHRIYTVAAGDTLSKIAAKFYNDSAKWDVIYEANKDRMKSASDLRVGQTLVVPNN